MRRRTTAVLVAGVLALAAVAAADSLRHAGPHGGAAVAGSAVRTGASHASRAHTKAGGTLFFSKRSGDGPCEIYAVRLPDPRPVGPLAQRGCNLYASPSGAIATGGPCPGGTVSVEIRDSVIGIPGCAPAWRTRSILTYFSGGRLWRLVPGCAECRALVATSRSLLRRLPPHQVIREAAWTDPHHLVLLTVVRHDYFQSLAFFHDGRVIRVRKPLCPQDSHLRSGKGVVTLRGAGDYPSCAFLVLDARGRLRQRLAAPQFLADGRAIAESGDGHWLATTLGRTIQVYPVGQSTPADPVALPLRAVDLAWAG